MSELTARTNDEGWATVFAAWLQRQPAGGAKDVVFIFSVGGGDLEKNVSPNLVRGAASTRAGRRRAICGIVGRDGGYTAKVADACVIVPTVNPETVTPHAEAFQAVVWHLLVSHPALKARADEVGIGRGERGRAVFLDRDGVLNARPCATACRIRPPASPSSKSCPASAEALALLRRQGFCRSS